MKSCDFRRWRGVRAAFSPLITPWSFSRHPWWKAVVGFKIMAAAGQWSALVTSRRSWALCMFSLCLPGFSQGSLTPPQSNSMAVRLTVFERLEVLAVFASTVLIQLGALFILKESVERFMEQPEVHTLCGIVPGLSSVLLPRMNPFVLINMAGALSLCVTYMLIEINNYAAVDTASAVAIALMTFGTMYPMSVYSGKVLLQTTPSHVIGQLDKLLREVSTLDGVLEVRNEHFWTVGFGSLAGSAHVRIRRDANEQLVLAHVTNRLLPLVSTLTVQLFKDDWTRPLLSGVLSSPAAPRPLAPAESYASSFPPAPYPSAVAGGGFDPLTSTPSKPSSPPPEFSFDTPGRNMQPLVLPAPGPHTHRPYGGVGLSYGAPPYAGVVGQDPARPRQGFGAPGLGLPSSQSYRTAFVGAPAPLRFGTSNPAAPQSQYRQYRP
uniref:Solute carrier family 30 member 6 n=1 Tax=Fundulus heteroclitus TaxID=8078 RepID=A0A3Q2P8A8_FUNHE